MNHLIHCKCGEVIVKSSNDEDVKVRSKVIVLKDGVAFAVCKSCNSEVKVPLLLDIGLLKSLSDSPPVKQLPLYVRRR